MRLSKEIMMVATEELNSLRKIVKNGTVDPLETEVEKYIEKIKIESNNK